MVGDLSRVLQPVCRLALCACGHGFLVGNHPAFFLLQDYPTLLPSVAAQGNGAGYPQLGRAVESAGDLVALHPGRDFLLRRGDADRGLSAAVGALY